MKELIVGFVAADQPGIVERLSQEVNAYGGNWLESQMVQLGGYFSGIARIEIDDGQYDGLSNALQELDGYTINLLSPLAASSDGVPMHLNIIGPDRTGILAEVSKALAVEGINVKEMTTSVAPAPMSGEPLFTADAEVTVPDQTDRSALNAELHEIGSELGVDVLIEESSGS